MRCEVCGRQLREDAKYCDSCGAKIQIVPQNLAEPTESVLDWNFLLLGILLSVGITVLITVLFSKSGMPVFFGGLFLPFFFRRVPKKKP
jgi:hypothetical protein